MVGVEVCIYLCGGDIFVSEHILYLSDTRATGKQMGGKGVAEGVGTDALSDTGILCGLADNIEHHNAGELCAAVTQKEVLLATALGCSTLLLFAVVKVAHNKLLSHATDRNKALLTALTQNSYVALAEEEVVQLECDKLRDAQTAGVEQL